MSFRTKIDPVKSQNRISYQSHVMMVGSCFSDEVGTRFKAGKMEALVNPFGTLYNPLSVASELDIILEGRNLGVDDLTLFKNRYLSFYHDTSFSSPDLEKTLGRINRVTVEANQFLAKTDYLFVTFGTARIFRLAGERRVVANCHKMPASNFERELLTVDAIVDIWSDIIGRLTRFNSNIKIYFTISPVRHWKDGAHGNQISKAVLLLAVERLIEKRSGLYYFPSYELVLDDLRDYRFYSDDMLHPDSQAIDYIWKYLTDTFFDSETLRAYNEVSKITTAMHHRMMSEVEDDHIRFGKSMIKNIIDLKGRFPYIDLKNEIEYFQKIADGLIP